MNDEPIISWKAAGVALGLLLTLATFLVKPLGVSTQFVVTDAVVMHQIAPEAAEQNKYLAKYGTKSDWGIGYGWMLVFGMLIGGGITARIFRDKQPEIDKGSIPPMWQAEFGPSEVKRYSAAFTGGLLLLFGARLAGGCTSGHMISGISQLAVSSFIFGVTTFAVAIVAAKFIYRNQGDKS
ncbi:MAG: hypothetical protein CMQ20_15150 [Gammaproteobacteria bacterium]|jgi:uncharacterized membrane protein YedE/YeeE|nr:hypothetical protein [Gammaproteobacteria bacterium]|tara:strand:+ start:303 stop:845 length:543 start_codon:yes stop_codon:yes gene_type:complete